MHPSHILLCLRDLRPSSGPRPSFRLLVPRAVRLVTPSAPPRLLAGHRSTQLLRRPMSAQPLLRRTREGRQRTFLTALTSCENLFFCHFPTYTGTYFLAPIRCFSQLCPSLSLSLSLSPSSLSVTFSPLSLPLSPPAGCPRALCPSLSASGLAQPPHSWASRASWAALEEEEERREEEEEEEGLGDSCAP